MPDGHLSKNQVGLCETVFRSWRLSKVPCSLQFLLLLVWCWLLEFVVVAVLFLLRAVLLVVVCCCCLLSLFRFFGLRFEVEVYVLFKFSMVFASEPVERLKHCMA